MKWIRTMVCALGMLACVSLSAFAAEYGEPNITTKTTMKELRENPSIKGSGYYTYCNEWIEGSTQYDDTPIEGYVSYAAAEDAAEGMNLVIENYNRGVQITWQVYTPEEIAENSSLGMVQLYYFPAKTANAKYAIVVPGNGGNTTAELNEGASIANQLHELGYAAFVLRYRSFLNASDNAPLYDIANAIKYLTENADQFGVQRENYALMGFSSGGHIVGLIGSDNEKFGYKAFGLPQPAALQAVGDQMPYSRTFRCLSRSGPRCVRRKKSPSAHSFRAERQTDLHFRSGTLWHWQYRTVAHCRMHSGKSGTAAQKPHSPARAAGWQWMHPRSALRWCCRRCRAPRWRTLRWLF